LAIAVIYRSLSGSFAWEIFTFEAEFDALGKGAVTDAAELVFFYYTTNFSIGAYAVPHFRAFLASDATNTNFHD
jgi:hypothetical protein